MHESVDRRDFLKGAATTLTALLSERGLSAARLLQDGEDAFTGAPVKFGIVGAGPWGREIIATLGRLPAAGVVAVCDSYPAFLKRAADAAPRATPQTDYRALLSSAEVEAVVIATPTHLHKEIALAALHAGKHVYCEAPLATTIDDARAIAVAARQAEKLVFAAGLQGRSNALYRHVWNFVRSGVLGEPAMVKAQWNRKDSWRRAAPTPEREREANWRLSKETSLGLPGEIGIHPLDIASAFLGTPPTAITGSGRVVQWRDGREVPDTVECMLEYPTGVRTTYTATLASSFGGEYIVLQGSNSSIFLKEKRSWLIKEADSALLGWEVYARKELVHDETGIALVADASKSLAQGKEPGKEGPVEPEREALNLALDRFARVIRGEGQVYAGPAEGLQATVVGIKAHEATLANGRVEIKPEWLALS
jgi:predicted dehydrogenase